MAEKILNTRIQLKYDSLANWNASTFKLKAGELAIVTVGEMKDGSTHSNAQYPVLFKVGTGDHTFSELPFASALAADVYDWAKAAKVQLVGKEIQFQDANGNKIKGVELNYVTETEAKKFISDALAAYSTTEQMTAAIKVETDRATGIEGGLDTRLKAVETAVGTGGSVDTKIQTAIEALDSSASHSAGADGLALGVTLVDGKVTSITGSIAAETYDAFGAAAAVQGNVDALADLVGTLPADAGVNTVVAYVQKKTEGIATDAALTELTNRVKDAEDAIDVIEADYLKSTDKTALETKITEAQTAAEGKVTELANGTVAQNTTAIAAINDSATGILAKAAEDATAKADAAQSAAETKAAELAGAAESAAKTHAETKASAAQSAAEAKAAELAKAAEDNAKAEVTALANGQVKTNKEAIEAINDTEDGILAQAKAYTDEVKAGILGEGITETYDTLVEIQNWINGAGVNATELTEAIAAEAKTRGEEDAKLSTAITNEASTRAEEDGKLDAAIKAEAATRAEEDAKLDAAIKAIYTPANGETAASGVLVTEIADLQEQITNLNITGGKVENAVNAEKANVASSLDAAGVEQVKGIKVNEAGTADTAKSLAESAKAEVKAIKVDEAAHADTADNATNAADAAKLGGVAASEYALKTQVATDIATAKSEAVAAAATDATTKANAAQAAAEATAAADATAKAATAKSEAIAAAATDAQTKADAALAAAKEDSSNKDAVVLVEAQKAATAAETNAKAYADGLAGNYATKAQGEKADTALQSVEAGTGLKVSTKADNKQTIDIDETVVFVFDCGSATKNID